MHLFPILSLLFVTYSAQAGVYDPKALWASGSRINIAFLNGTKEHKKLVIKAAREWEKYVNLDFRFYDQVADAPIRVHLKITFFGKSDHSVIGLRTGMETVYKSTMALSRVRRSVSLEEKYGTILHEFGHALGLLHEHQHPAMPHSMEQDSMARICAGQNWNWDTCLHNMAPHPANQVGFTPWDIQSIMLYPLPEGTFTDPKVSFPENNDLSSGDISLIQRLYP